MGPELEMGMGFGMDTIGNSNAYLYGLPAAGTETLQIDDLLDFSTTQEAVGFESAGGGDNGGVPGGHHFQQMMPMQYASANNNNNSSGNNVNATSVAAVATAGNCGGLVDGANGGFGAGSELLPAFPEDLYMPSEEAAELEWLSKFVEDSFSDMPFPSPPPTMGNFSNVNPLAATTADENNNGSGNNCRNGHLHHHNSVPGRARSKRSRAPGPAPSTHLAAAATTTTTWSSLPPQLCTSTSSSSSSSSETKQRGGGGIHGAKKKESMMGAGGAAMENGSGGGGEGGVRRCTHCSSEKTPQWRTGPLGPKTLCNACGVRYKSGRLVPEYRPAASPTFVLTKHSNSHRKVIELRRQKELIFRHQTQSHHQYHRETSPSTTATTNGTTTSTTRPDLLLRDYEVC